jgi:hypothetical protein
MAPRRFPIAATLCFGIAAGVWLSGQTPPAPAARLDRHPAIEYASRPTSDPVARLNRALENGTRTLVRDASSGYLRSVLEALDVPVESQLLVFSKTGVQREHTGPRHPRALYYNDSVIVGYIPGAPSLEIAAQDPRQGMVFYTLEQAGPAAPTFGRRTTCLTCHVSSYTLGVPGVIARSHMVGADGRAFPALASPAVNHTTPHTARWGGWYVTATDFAPPPYLTLGHLGNLTSTGPTPSGPGVLSNTVLVEWVNSEPETRGYLSRSSDVASLLVFDHQMHAMNLLTRLNWESRVAGNVAAVQAAGPLRDRAHQLADYLLFVAEEPPTVPLVAPPGLAERMRARVPADRRGRSLGDLDLERRLLRFPCSYMVYSEAFDALPAAVKEAVYRRMFDILSTRNRDRKYAHLSIADRLAIRQILRDTKSDLPADLRG